MSTRSGKRLHASLHENFVSENLDIIQSERKTRNRHHKDTNEVLNGDQIIHKKHNYVRYPGDEVQEQPAHNNKKQKEKKHLIEQNEDVLKNIVSDDASKPTRVTRRTKGPDTVSDACNIDIEKIDKKSNKKKKKSKNAEISTNEKENDAVPIPKKKMKKKGKKRKTKATENNRIYNPVANECINKSSDSVESFHSAAGSPVSCQLLVSENKPVNENSDVNEQNNEENELTEKIHKRKSSTRNRTFDKNDSISKEKSESKDNDTFEINTEEKTDSCIKMLNETFEKDQKNNTDFIAIDPSNIILNGKFDKTPKKSLNDTADNRKSPRVMRQSKVLDSTFDKENDNKLDVTFEKSTSFIGHITSDDARDTTFDKEKDIKLDVTFDKSTASVSSKNSLISSDGNSSFDKSNNNLQMTSNESKTENILNVSPVLIESSMDDSIIIETLKTSPKPNQLKPVTPLKREGTFTKNGSDIVMSPKSAPQKTPTKRVSLPSPGCTPFHVSFKSSEKKKIALNVTRSLEKPSNASLAEPMSTRATKVMFCSPVNLPHVADQRKSKIIKSSLKGSNKSFVFEEKESASVPRSVGSRKRSLTHEPEAAGAKRKRLVEDLQLSAHRLSRPRTVSATVKSSEPLTPAKKTTTPLKTKSESKRVKLPNFAALHQKQFSKMESLDECQERRAKRARQLLVPTGGLTVLERSSPKAPQNYQLKSDYLSSQIAHRLNLKKIDPGTPLKTSKADHKRTSTEPNQTPNLVKTVKESVKKLDTTKSQLNQPDIKKLPTLDSLRPGYTRFGFKMNCDVNPFSIPSKRTENKLKEVKNVVESKPRDIKINGQIKIKKDVKTIEKPNGLLKRQNTQPSLTGTTTSRKEVAKQMIMREKSFTLADKRKEARTIIKGVRTNRRFELQMRSRNINA